MLNSLGSIGVAKKKFELILKCDDAKALIMLKKYPRRDSFNGAQAYPGITPGYVFQTYLCPIKTYSVEPKYAVFRRVLDLSIYRCLSLSSVNGHI